jgi:hypothetical protein
MAGERIKSDRRDAINLAKLQRAGELSPVWVPDPAHEAIAIWCACDWRQCARCCRRASNSPASYCAMAIITTGQPGL